MQPVKNPRRNALAPSLALLAGLVLGDAGEELSAAPLVAALLLLLAAATFGGKPRRVGLLFVGFLGQGRSRHLGADGDAGLVAPPGRGRAHTGIRVLRR